MPIYKETNDLPSEPIFHFSPETAVVHFGSGDILISNGKRPADDGTLVNELFFTPADKPHPIGEFTTEHAGESVYPPVTLRFDYVESVDAVIAQLQELKKNWDAPAATKGGTQ